MTRTASAIEPRTGADLPNVATVTADEAAVVSFKATLNPDDYRAGAVVPLAVAGIRHGRLGFGLGGGLS